MLWVSLHKWKERRIPNQRGKNFYYSNFLMSNLPTYYIDGKIHASNKNKVWTQKKCKPNRTRFSIFVRGSFAKTEIYKDII